jgi:hypothetical protein
MAFRVSAHKQKVDTQSECFPSRDWDKVVLSYALQDEKHRGFLPALVTRCGRPRTMSNAVAGRVLLGQKGLSQVSHAWDSQMGHARRTYFFRRASSITRVQ